MTLSDPIVPRSLVQEAFERIADAIFEGEIAPGDHIQEARLARQLGISRAVVREALQRLEGLWLVSRTPNVGAHVIRPNPQDLYELCTMLEALCGLAAKLAATHMPDDEIADTSAFIDAVASAEPPPPVLKVTEEFFHRIARGSRNARLERMVCDDFRHQLTFYSRHVEVHPGWPQVMPSEWRGILDAIARRAPDAAEAAIRTHVRHWRANLFIAGSAAD